MDEPFLNLDPVVEDYEDSDGERSDSVVEVLQSRPVQTIKPNEQGTIRRIKTKVSRPVSSPVRKPRTLYPKNLLKICAEINPLSLKKKAQKKKEPEQVEEVVPLTIQKKSKIKTTT